MKLERNGMIIKINKFIVFILLTLFLSSLAIAVGRPALVGVQKVTQGFINPLSKTIGTVEFEQNSKLASKIEGYVTKVNFSSGDRVKKGDILATLDNEILNITIESEKASLNIVKIELANARKNLHRYEKLMQNKSIAQNIYDDSLLKVQVLQNKVLVLESDLKKSYTNRAYKTIKAPFDGIIISKNIQKGQWINRGEQIAKLLNTSVVNILFDVSTKYINTLNSKENYEIVINNTTYKAPIYAKLPVGNKLTRMFPLKFQLKIAPDTFIFDGMQSSVKLPTKEKQLTFIVPRDSIVKRAGKDVIFIVDDAKARMIGVKIVGYEGTNVGVKNNELKVGQEVIIKGNAKISSGKSTKIISSSK